MGKYYSNFPQGLKKKKRKEKYGIFSIIFKNVFNTNN